MDEYTKEDDRDLGRPIEPIFFLRNRENTRMQIRTAETPKKIESIIH
jgi:hypothetical protein